MQTPPLLPQATALLPAWQMPLTSQHPSQTGLAEHVPPQPSSAVGHLLVQLGTQGSWQIPFWQTSVPVQASQAPPLLPQKVSVVPAWHMPSAAQQPTQASFWLHLPPHPSSAVWHLPAHWGVQQAPVLVQTAGLAQVPHVPPQPLGPHCLPVQEGSQGLSVQVRSVQFCSGPHTAQAPPTLPHAEVARPGSHFLSAVQQPSQLFTLQMPPQPLSAPWHLPAQLGSHPHNPPVHSVPSQTSHSAPFLPHAAAVLPGRQTFVPFSCLQQPVQLPSGHTPPHPSGTPAHLPSQLGVQTSLLHILFWQLMAPVHCWQASPDLPQNSLNVPGLHTLSSVQQPVHSGVVGQAFPQPSVPPMHLSLQFGVQQVPSTMQICPAVQHSFPHWLTQGATSSNWSPAVSASAEDSSTLPWSWGLLSKPNTVSPVKVSGETVMVEPHAASSNATATTELELVLNRTIAVPRIKTGKALG